MKLNPKTTATKSKVVSTTNRVGRPSKPVRTDGIRFVTSRPAVSQFVGQTLVQACGGFATCIEVIKRGNSHKLKVRWQDGLITEVWLKSWQKRILRHPLSKTLAGVGFLGIDHPSTKGKNIGIYSIWKEKCQLHAEGTTVLCPEWLEWTVFYEWYKKTVLPRRLAAPKANFVLETDLSVAINGGKKTYSPTTVHILPTTVNIVLSAFLSSVNQLSPLLDGSLQEVPLPKTVNYLKQKDRLRVKVAGVSFYFGVDMDGRRMAAQTLLDTRHRILMEHAEVWSHLISPASMELLRGLKDRYQRYLGLVTVH